MNYRLAYAVGFHPWEELAEHPRFAGKLLELVAREEDGREPPYGPALDLGCGSGVWGVQLAKRGWRVTGGDIVEKALRRAHERVAAAGLEMRLVNGDVTVLLDCFAPRRRGPLPRGARRADVERAFPAWEVTDIEIADTEPDALARLFKFDERFYRASRPCALSGDIEVLCARDVVVHAGAGSRLLTAANFRVK